MCGECVHFMHAWVQGLHTAVFYLLTYKTSGLHRSRSSSETQKHNCNNYYNTNRSHADHTQNRGDDGELCGSVEHRDTDPLYRSDYNPVWISCQMEQGQVKMANQECPMQPPGPALLLN